MIDSLVVVIVLTLVVMSWCTHLIFIILFSIFTTQGVGLLILKKLSKPFQYSK